MYRQSVICIEWVSAFLHILRINGRSKLPVPAADENVAQKCLLTVLAQEVNSNGISAYIDLFHAQVQPALAVSGLQLYKSYVLSFFLPFIFINIGN